MTDLWFSTPSGPMRRFEEAKASEPSHWYIDRDQHWRCFRDSDCKPTRPPTWFRRQSVGEFALQARREARKASA